MVSRDPQRPNVVVVVSDDQGHWALGCAGNDEIRTPHLDELAAGGVRFDSFFCSTPVCSPSRATLLTGELPSQHGVHDAVHHGEHPDDPVQYLVGRDTYADRLAAEGYGCAHVGKWHLGDSGRAQAGFTDWFALAVQGTGYTDPLVTRGGSPVTAQGYTTDVLADEALTVLRRSLADDRPLLLNLCFNAPHSPWIDQHPDDLLRVYDGCRFDSCPVEPEHPWSRGFVDTSGEPVRVSRHVDLAWERREDTLRGYFAAVTGMDRSVGRLLAALDQEGLRHSTLVMFLSDNGFSAGHHGIWGKGNGTRPANMFDTVVKVPCIVSQPGRVPGGRVVDDLLSVYDLRPTLLEWAGVRDDPPQRRPGRSFAALLAGTEQERPQDEVVVYDEYGGTRMIRTRVWKLVHRHPDGPHELYHLAVDADEVHDLVAAGAPEVDDVVADLAYRLDTWFARWTDPAVDGRRFAVTGLGQVAPVDGSTPAATAFVQRRPASPATGGLPR